jgi:hypothetical protein
MHCFSTTEKEHTMTTLTHRPLLALCGGRFVAATLFTLGLTACGGGGSSADTATSPSNTPVPAAVAYAQSVIATSSDTTDPVDTSAVELAVDDSAEPSPVLIE